MQQFILEVECTYSNSTKCPTKSNATINNFELYYLKYKKKVENASKDVYFH